MIKRLVLRMLCGLLLVLFAQGCNVKNVVEVEVDFGITEEAASMMGFLHGVEDTHRIPNEWLEPLFSAPVSWRIGPKEELVERARELGVEKPIIVVSDGWNGTAPSQDWQAWEGHVRNLALQFGTNVIYDIANEPDNPFFWTPQNGHEFPRGWADLHETFRRSHDVIRSELGAEALISGPSFTLLWGSEKRLYDFVQFCHENDLTIQILSVHVIYQPDIALPLVSNTLRKYRKDFIESGNFAKAGVEFIHVNEYGMPNDYARPGSVLAMLRHLELGGADAANRASWTGRVENISNSIDGYLRFVLPASSGDPIILGDIMFSDTEPRPVWWIYRYYAAGVTSRVQAKTNSRFIVAVASAESDLPQQAQVIIGASASTLGRKSQEIGLQLMGIEKLSFIGPESEAVEVEVKKIVNDETAPLLSLPTVFKTEVPINNGKAELDLPALGDFDAYVVFIRKV